MQLFIDAHGAGVGIHTGWTVGFIQNGPLSKQCMERTISHSFCSDHMGSPLGLDVNPISLDNVKIGNLKGRIGIIKST